MSYPQEWKIGPAGARNRRKVTEKYEKTATFDSTHDPKLISFKDYF